MTKIKIILPTWNESENIIELFERIRKVMVPLYPDYEVILVDDNSPHRTAELAMKYGEKYNHIRVIERSHKKGYGSALRDGIKCAIEDQNTLYLITMDADMTHQPEDIPKLIKVAKNVDVVQGSKYVKGGLIKGWSLYRWLISLAANFLIRTLFLTGMRDHTTNFRVFSVKAAHLIANKTRSSGYEWLIEALLLLRGHQFKIAEVPISFINRKKGKSKLKIVDVIKWFKLVMRLRFGKKYD